MGGKPCYHRAAKTYINVFGYFLEYLDLFCDRDSDHCDEGTIKDGADDIIIIRSACKPLSPNRSISKQQW